MQLRTVSRAPVLLCLVAAGAVLGVMFVPNGEKPPPEVRQAWSPTRLETPIVLKATGHEYFWRFRFPGPDRAFDTDDDVHADKEVHLPAQRDVVVFVTSDDFVYTLAIPELQLRQLAVPELTYKMEFHTARTGSFDVLADPLCSVRLFHDEYMGRIVVQSESEFDLWYQNVQ